jgi:hypothetical protein
MKSFRRFGLGVFALFLALVLNLLCADFAQAQATLAVSGSSATLTKTGYTELIGAVSLTVNSGTTVAGTVEVFLPNTVFSDASGVTLNGTGGLAAATIAAVVPSNGVVDINIPAGAGAGSSLTISGIRVSAVGLTNAKVTAAISSTGNFVLAGQNSVSLVTGLADGLTVDTSAGNTLSTSGTVIISSPGAIKVAEGWNQAFSSSLGVAGQTAKTQVVFQVVGLPDNVGLTFPAMVSSDGGDGAYIMTLSGVPETLTNQSPTNRVIYEFNDSPTSPNFIDSFSVIPTVSLNGDPGNGTAYIQVALGPIGALLPNAQYPSVAIPRFAEVFLPPATPEQEAITTLSLPVLPTATNDSFSLSNTGSGGALITAQAMREDGTPSAGVTTPATINLASKQTALLSLTDIFGSSATPDKIAVVELSAANTGMVANAIDTIQASRIGVAAPPVEQLLAYVPFDRQIGSDVPVLTVQNATDADIPAQITVFSSTGASLATVTPTIKAHGALRQDLVSLFAPATSIRQQATGGDALAAFALPLDGYVSVHGTTGVLRTIMLNRPTTAAESIPSLTDSSDSPQVFPFFAFGSGYNTLLTLINLSASTSVRVTLNPYSSTGTALVTQPVVQSIAPGQKQTFDFESLFGQVDFASGYFSINLDSIALTPFSTHPSVAGSVRVSAPGSRAVVPFLSKPGKQFYMTPAVETSDSYTGIAIYNPTANPATVTFDAFASGGTTIGSATITIPTGLANIHLLREMISKAVGNDNILVRITASTNVSVLGLRGTFNGTELIYLRGETQP